ncbi:DNA primase small subunit PRIM1 [Carpediemonas membranifera]|uniref:DNA primase n=1 Tax=Carpediemonas membranifera TaxID=201153 RepID=A0A8J6DXF7_9EUKA|nr:DNA primase small subunit PRIM1 [Carpediemonas membranifera]|eukprot:KAG9390054.1 DNA primase small subunit PRIM1 [Carpediemonas membranifera]
MQAAQEVDPFYSTLERYYKEKLPIESLMKFIKGTLNDSERRELAVILTTRSVDPEKRKEVFSRPHVCRTAEDLRLLFTKVWGTHVYNAPTRLEIGAVYTKTPTKGELTKLEVDNKDLIFDIDLTDYDRFRHCCQGKKICRRCWEYMKIGADITKKAMEEFFDFKHMLLVFSGRRGIHVWVSDFEARLFTAQERGAVVRLLSYERDGNKPATTLPIAIREYALNKCRAAFEENVFEGLGLLRKFNGGVDSEDGRTDARLDWTLRERVLELAGAIAGKENSERITKSLPELPKCRDDSREAAFELAARLGMPIETHQGMKGRQPDALLDLKQFDRLCLALFFPRLDEQVTRHPMHLLKAPFLVHPGTSNVCTPIPDLESFKLDEAVNLMDLVTGETDGRDSDTVECAQAKFDEAVQYFAGYVEELARAAV